MEPTNTTPEAAPAPSSPGAPPAPADVKPGHQTTEFWVTLIVVATVAVLLVLQAVRGQPVDVATAITTLGGAAAAAGYARSRALVKTGGSL